MIPDPQQRKKVLVLRKKARLCLEDALLHDFFKSAPIMSSLERKAQQSGKMLQRIYSRHVSAIGNYPQYKISLFGINIVSKNES
jgi:hypothetical protein